MTISIFNPLTPIYKSNRELRFLVSDIEILKCIDATDRYMTTHDYYVPCTKKELPIKLRSTDLLVPSFLRTRITNQSDGLKCNLIFTHSPTYKEKLTEDHFKLKYPGKMKKITECSLENTFSISKVKLGNLILPELKNTGCLEMIEISSPEFKDYRFLSGEFEYENESELKEFFLSMKYHNNISLMCSYEQFICTYSPLLDIMYSDAFFNIRNLMKLKYKYLMKYI